MRFVLALIVTVLACLTASTTADAARLVVSPRNGAVEDGHATLRVRAGDRATLTARLNGRDVAKDFAAPRRGVRRLDASISQGLRHGRNVLQVTVQRPNGTIRRTRVRFTVPATVRLVGAGRDERAVVGKPIGLSGRVAGARGSLRWNVVAGPRARLASAAGRTATFTPTEPGTYTLRLTAGEASDTVEIDAGPGPLVPIDTRAIDPQTDKVAIQVGSRYYTPHNLGGTQVLVLDRRTLKLVSDNGWTSVAQVKQDIASHNDSQLVIAVQRSYMDAPMTGLFTSIGVPAAASATQTGEAFSAIGIPGLAEGQANWKNTATRSHDDPERPAEMTGYLSPDTYDNYGFIPGSRQEDFSFGSAAGSPCRQGDPGGICANPNNVGYLVTVRDRFSLADVEYLDNGAYQFFATNGRNLTAAQQGEQAANMLHTLQQVLPGDVVTIQGISNTQPGEAGQDRPLVGTIDAATMHALAQEIAALGGTRDAFNRASAVGAPDDTAHGQPYMLIGWPHASSATAEGTGAESATGVAGAAAPTALNGTLRPDNSSQLRPAEVSRTPGASETLDQIVLAQPGATAWPLQGRALKALSWLGDTDPRLGPDPRTAYWTQDLDEADTNSIIEGLRDQAYPDNGEFTNADFTSAKAELIQELRWVGNTRSYLDKLSQPFSSSALGGWAQAQDIGDRVYHDATSSRDEVVMQWLEFTDLLLGFGGSPGQTVSHLLSLGMWAWGAAANGGPGVAEVRTTADEVGTAFIVQAKAAQAATQNMGDVIVSDYAKLKQVGTYGGCNAGAKGCPPGLAFSAADRKRASADVYRSIELEAWVKLLPLGYPTFDLVPTYASSGAPQNPGGYHCNADTEQPFDGYPAGAHTSFLQQWDPSPPGEYKINGQYEMYALARDHGLVGEPPKAEILDRVFGPLSPSGDPRSGGLGMSLAAYVRMTSPRPWSRTSCTWH